LICIADLDLDEMPLTGGGRGRTRTATVAGSSGRYTRAEPVRDQERGYDLAADATVRAALLRQHGRGSDGRLSLTPADLRKKIYRRPRRTLVVFVVDSSDSMGDDGTYNRIRAAKGAVLAILGKAYQKRHRVGLVVFREESATLVLPPTTSLGTGPAPAQIAADRRRDPVCRRPDEGLATDPYGASERSREPAVAGDPLRRRGQRAV
jgi:magnesium chelatase subunit D